MLGLSILTLVRLIVAGVTPLAPDEAYYWVWSRALAPGYLDHPPMVALWIRAGTALAGSGPLGVRLLAPLAGSLGTVLLVRTGDVLFPGRCVGRRAALLLNATLLFGVGAVTMTPDTPLLFFWTVALWAAAELTRAGPGQGAWWLLVGAACGLAMASKYTAILLPAGLVLWTLAMPGPRRWLRTPWPWLAACVAVLMFLPTLLWNAAHGWASFAKQGGRGFVWQPGAALGHVAELIGGQAGLATPLIFLLFVAGTFACLRRARGDAGAALLVAAILPGTLLFVQHALGDRVQANWPSVLYPACALAAAASLDMSAGRAWRRLTRPAVALGAGLTALAYLQATLDIIPVAAKSDPTAHLAGWPGLVDQVADAARQQGAAFVAADRYGDAALLTRLMPSLPVVGVEPRWALFNLRPAWPLLAGHTGILVQSARRTQPPDDADWSSLVPAGEVTRRRDGEAVETFRLWRVQGRAGSEPAVVLPH